MTKQEMTDYREKYYRPDNATLVLVGDVDEKTVMPLVTKYFGPLKSKGPSPRVRTEEPYSRVLQEGLRAETSRRRTSRSASSAARRPTRP